MAVTPDRIADRLGRPLSSAEERQVPIWIDDAAALIDARASRLGLTADVDQVDRVVALAVTAMARRPTDETQVDVAVDDGRVSRRYSSSRGEVFITDAWWDDLGLAGVQATSWSGSVGYSR